MTSIFNLIEYDKNYSKKSESSWQNYRDESNSTTADSESIIIELSIKERTPDVDNTKDIEIAVLL